MSFCLRKEFADIFRGKLKSGEITPKTLSEMDSAQRLGYFSSWLDVPTAHEVNALVERKLLMKNQEQGLINAMQHLIGQKEYAKQDVVSRISRFDKLLSPADKEHFMADLVAKKLGLKGEVTPEEAKEISRLAKEASDAQTVKLSTLKSTSDEFGMKPTNRDVIAKAGVKYQNLVDYINSLKPQGNPWMHLAEFTSLPQTLLTTITHFSAPFVQNWGMIGTKEWYQGWPKMFQYWDKEESYKELQGFIIAHPYHKQAVEAKLGITKLGDTLSTREEAMYSSLLEHIPGLKIPVKKSSRAFVGYNNYVRFTRFANILDALKMRGEDISPGSKVVRDVAIIVNDFTGRGALGPNDRWAVISEPANTVLFTPRGLSSTIGMLNPVKYAKLEPYVRMQALKQLTSAIIITSASMELAHLGGAQVDWRNLTIKIGPHTISPFGRVGTYVKLWETMVTGRKVNSLGISYDITTGWGAEGRMGEVWNFFRNKLAPLAGAIVDGVSGKNSMGQKVSWVGEGGTGFTHSELYEKMSMITMQDWINSVQNDPDTLRAVMTSSVALFGIGVSTTEPTKWDKDSGKVMNQFYNKVGEQNFEKANKEYDDKFNTWFEKVNVDPKFQKLSDDDKEKMVVEEKKKLKNATMREQGFYYKQPKRTRFSILSEE